MIGGHATGVISDSLWFLLAGSLREYAGGTSKHCFSLCKHSAPGFCWLFFLSKNHCFLTCGTPCAISLKLYFFYARGLRVPDYFGTQGAGTTHRQPFQWLRACRTGRFIWGILLGLGLPFNDPGVPPLLISMRSAKVPPICPPALSTRKLQSSVHKSSTMMNCMANRSNNS